MILLLLKSLIHLKDWLKKRKLKRIFKQVSNQFTFKLFLSFESSSFKAFTSNNSDIRDFSFSACFFIFSQRADISSPLVWLRTWREKVIYIQTHDYFIKFILLLNTQTSQWFSLYLDRFNFRASRKRFFFFLSLSCWELFFNLYYNYYTLRTLCTATLRTKYRKYYWRAF